MKSFNDWLLTEAKGFEIVKDEVPLNLDYLKHHGDFSPKISQADLEHYIGTIIYNFDGKEVWYEMFELDSYDKKEFGSDGVFGFSSKKMTHQARVLGKIKNGKIYFLDDAKYADESEVDFDSKGVKIKLLRVKNKKYHSKITSLI